MNVENFSDFIKHPANLYRVNYQELKGLVLQYPNALNLRILLLLKSKIENHPDFEKNLRAASTYAVDRSRIFDLLENPELQLEVLDNVKVEDGAIAISIEDDLKVAPVTPVIEGDGAPNDYSWLNQPVENIEAISASLDEDSEKKQGRADKLSDQVRKENIAPSVFEKYLEHLGHFFSGILGITETGTEEKTTDGDLLSNDEAGTDLSQTKQPEQMKKLQKLQKHKGIDKNIELDEGEDNEWELEEEVSTPEPLPKEAFASWHQKEENFEIEFDALEQIVFDAVKEEEENSESSKNQKSEAEILARRSLKLKTGIVSETLAELLVKQENYEQAIEMYEQLILKYPEKSAFFALQIENLKKL